MTNIVVMFKITNYTGMFLNIIINGIDNSSIYFTMMYRKPKIDSGVMSKLIRANINYPGSYNKTHIHPNSTWSGAYYVKVPEDSGCIWVEDPRAGPNLLMPRRLEGLPRQLWRVVKYPPVEGQCIMFPAWLPHGVESNQTKEKGEKGWRVSVSFNFIQGNSK